jgi:hypothetical protein
MHGKRGRVGPGNFVVYASYDHTIAAASHNHLGLAQIRWQIITVP